MADESYFVWSKPRNPKIQPHVAPIRDIKPAKYKTPLFFKGKPHSDLVFTTNSIGKRIPAFQFPNNPSNQLHFLYMLWSKKERWRAAWIPKGIHSLNSLCWFVYVCMHAHRYAHMQHRITEEFCWWPWKGHLVQPPAMTRGIFNQTRLVWVLYNLTFNVSRTAAATTSLGILCQCFTTLSVKNLYPV